jgi:hypothetical protein
MGMRFAVYLGVLSGPDYQSLLEEGWNALLAGSQAMHERLEEEKPEEMFLRALRELLAQGKIFLRCRDAGLSMGGPEDRAEMLGWYDDCYLYLLPEATYSRIVRHYRDQGCNFPVRELTLRKMLKEAGILIEKNGRRTSSEYLDGRTQRVLVLNRQQFD